ncbi:MAG TPA: hypothetical protein VGR28_07720 [Candidatus Thermoplasmatota archaeon]|nr:hypothetical protein [Candidatus Thermoplasmatota archaeon]
MQAKSYLMAGMLVASFAVIAGSASATQTCDPTLTICTGNSGSDEFAHCDGMWVDLYLQGPYAQICSGYDGQNHVCVEQSYDNIPETCTLDVHA